MGGCVSQCNHLRNWPVFPNLQDTNGVIIVEIIPNSPAAKAGRRSHDVVRKVGDKDINTPEDFQKAIQELEPGDRVIFVEVQAARHADTGGDRQQTRGVLKD